MIRLVNAFLDAGFDPSTGLLTSLRKAGVQTPELLAGSLLSYADGQGLFPDPTGPSTTRDWRVTRLEHTPSRVVSTLESDLVTIEHVTALEADSPFLDIAISITGKAPAGTPPVRSPLLGILSLKFQPDFIDHFEDEQDLYFDGAHLAARKILRPWRVFFKGDRSDGLLLATRTFHDMACVAIGARAVGLCPQSPRNYETLAPVALPVEAGRVFAASLQLGPWEADRHESLLKAGHLHETQVVDTPPATGQPPADLEGTVLHFAELATADQASREYAPDRWLRVDMPWSVRGEALMTNAGVHPPMLSIQPPVRGPHRVFVGVVNGQGLQYRLPGDPYARYRFAPPRVGHDQELSPFSTFLCGHHQPTEIDLGVMDLTDQPLQVGDFPGKQEITVLDYIRFMPLSEADRRTWRKQRASEPCIELSGFCDTPDISLLTDTRDPDVNAYRANIWEHVEAGIRKIYWRIDGQCSDYPSRVNTMRYPSAKVHGVFTPHAKAYGRALLKVDMLQLAVEAAREHGAQLWGWMRFNSYIGNVASDFFKNNPQWWEHSPTGYKGRQLCIAIPEVRKHKIDILVEAAGYGLAGLNLGFLRHPAVLQYHPVMTESFEKKYGQPAPRNAPASDFDCIRHLPPDGELDRLWYQHRADYLTLFMHELRGALAKAGMASLPISIWVRQNHCLFDGIDLPRWLDEGLCQEVVVNGVIGGDFVDEKVYGVDPAWRRMVQAKARLIRCASLLFRYEQVKDKVQGIIDDGYDGLCTYESDFSALDARCLEIYNSLRGR